MSTIPCPQCAGRGIITTMASAPIKGCKLTSSVHTAPQHRFCGACKGTGTVEAVRVASPATSEKAVA